MVKEFQELYNTMLHLRTACPWDKKQTADSLIPLTIEEVYELADAIYNKNANEIKEELGDLFMHLIFYSILAEEKKDFQLAEILMYVNRKLIFRHPHIFKNNIKLETAEQVLENWQKRKKLEGKKYIFSGIAYNLPSITKAKRIQEKASSVNFDWQNKEQVLEKVQEEMNELQQAIKEQSNIEEEFGDLLFALVNYSRFLKIDADKALQLANQKFIRRFTEMEKIAETKTIEFIQLPQTEKEKLWNEVKEKEK